jgi:thiamine-monophosphate kinase
MFRFLGESRSSERPCGHQKSDSHTQIEASALIQHDSKPKFKYYLVPLSCLSGPQQFKLDCLVLPERDFIARVRQLAGRADNRETSRGIGDDCAILQIPAGRQLLVTTDLCVEDVHFRREWHPAVSVGHRCLTRGLSDIAAMGGQPIACFLSLAVPPSLAQKWVDQFLLGLLQLARQFQVTLAGGDTSAAEKITADIVVLGTAPAGKAVQRSGARPGDSIYVTGELGNGAAVLKQLFAGKKIRPSRTNRHFYPVPRVAVGKFLLERKLATAMIDISDGLSVDLAHICEESGVSAVIEAKAIPITKSATLELALHGGDDYELLFTARPGLKLPARIAGVPITRIGTMLPKSFGYPDMRIRDASGREKPLLARGWQHFGKI